MVGCGLLRWVIFGGRWMVVASAYITFRVTGCLLFFSSGVNRGRGFAFINNIGILTKSIKFVE